MITNCAYCRVVALDKNDVLDSNGHRICKACATGDKYVLAVCGCGRVNPANMFYGDKCYACHNGNSVLPTPGQVKRAKLWLKDVAIVECWTCTYCHTQSVRRGNKQCWSCDRTHEVCVTCAQVTAKQGMVMMSVVYGKNALVCRPCYANGSGCTKCGRGVLTADIGPGLKAATLLMPTHADNGYDLTIREGVVCAACSQKTTRACSLCHMKFGNLQLISLLGRDEEMLVCPDCAPSLHSCRGCRYWGTGYAEPIPDKFLCKWCVPLSRPCGVCGVELVANDPDAFCRGCRPILEYNERIPIRFFGTPPEHTKLCEKLKPLYNRGSGLNYPAHAHGCTFNGIYYGVELEVENRVGNREKNAAEVRRLFEPKSVIVKRDGSLETGFEIVSAPATVEWHQTAWDKLFLWQNKDMPFQAQDAPRATCGMHVHVSRGSMTWLQIGKIVQFIHEPKNYDFVRLMAGRPCSPYADFLLPKKLHGTPHYHVRNDDERRYTAVNLANRATIEFRIFRSTLNRQTFLARLEFCAALVAFCAPSVAGISELSHTKFLEWLRPQPRGLYPNLYEFLGEVGQLPARSTRRP